MSYYDDLGKFAMEDEFVVNFTTISENSVVESKVLLDKPETYVDFECEVYYKLFAFVSLERYPFFFAHFMYSETNLVSLMLCNNITMPKPFHKIT